MKKYKTYALLILLTFLSGIISAYLPSIIQNEWITFYGAGIVFGLMMGIWFMVTQKNHPIKTLLWSGLSVLAYYLAVRTAVVFISSSSSKVDTWGFFAAGLVGAAILAISTTFLIKKVDIIQDILQILLVIVLGGLAGLTFSDNFHFNLHISFTLWQMVVGIALGVSVDRNNKRNNVEIV